MKKIGLISLLLICASATNITFAQNSSNKKNVEIKKENDEDVKLEIKNGEVFLNGEKVVQNKIQNDEDRKTIQKKIIINGRELDEDEMQAFNFEFENNENKAMLGVRTKISKNNNGAEVENVMPNSPAQKIGLQVGDLITKVNSSAINNPKDLVNAISHFKPGSEIEITFERADKMLSKNVVLEARKDATKFRGSGPYDEDIFSQFERGDYPFLNNPYLGNPFSKNRLLENTPKIGISVEDRADGQGVLVAEVLENSAAQKAGIEKNDVVVVYNSKTIGNVDELMEAIAESKNKEKVLLDIIRSGVKRQISLSIPKNLRKRDL